MKKEFLRKYQRVPVTEIRNEACKEPLVSVLVMAYNHKNYIKDCLESILMQRTTFPIEIIVGEDDSSDGTRDICIEYANEYPKLVRLFLHSRKNNIIINNKPTWHFNSIHNLLMARGNFIAFCEGDDFWTDPLKLQKQINFLQDHSTFSACAHLSNVIFEGTETKNELRFKKNSNKTVFKIDDTLESSPFHTGSLVFRKELIDLRRLQSCGLFPLNREHPIMIILASNGPIKRLPETMSTYRRNPGGIAENIEFDAIYKANIEMANALICYIKGFKWKGLYIKGHWHKFMISSTELNFKSKIKHFLYFFFSSFYRFPRNGKKILHAIKLLICR